MASGLQMPSLRAQQPPTERDAAAAAETTKIQWTRPTPRIPGLYRMSINPERPDSGITTGLVVAYGHVLQPPYRVEARGQAVFVNGVQIDPPIRPLGLIEKEKRYQESLAARPAAIRAHDDSVALGAGRPYRIYDSLQPLLGHQRAFDAAVAWLKQYPMVESVRTNGGGIAAYLKGGGDLGHIRLQPHWNPVGHLPPGITLPTPEEYARRRVDRIVRALVDGRVGVFCYGYGQGTSLEGFKVVKRILADPQLTDSERYVQLKAETPAAAAFLDNYEPSEWAILDDSSGRR